MCVCVCFGLRPRLVTASALALHGFCWVIISHCVCVCSVCVYVSVCTCMWVRILNDVQLGPDMG